MTVLITANNLVASEYSTFNSKVASLAAACLFGNGGVSDSLRISLLNATGILGEMTPVYPTGISLNGNGGVTLSPAGTGATAARLVFPYNPTDSGEGCMTFISAINSPTTTQFLKYGNWRIGIGTGTIQIVNTADASKIIEVDLDLDGRGFMSADAGLKDFILVTEIRFISGSGVRLTASLHSSTGSVLASTYGGLANVTVDMTVAGPYVGGVKVSATTYKAMKHYGHMIFHRQLSDEEKVTAAAQLAGYANSIGASIA